MADFVFYTRFNQVELLGVKASNVAELLEKIKAVPESAIYYHTHKFLEQHHFLHQQYSSDFAYWVDTVLGEKVLAEELNSINIVEYNNVEDIRAELIRILTDFIEKHDVRNCPKGSELYFMASKAFIVPTPLVAHNLYEFRLLLDRVSLRSIYFHVFESKLRLVKGDNDFTLWIRGLDKNELADAVSSIDPYAYSLEALRDKIVATVDKYLLK